MGVHEACLRVYEACLGVYEACLRVYEACLRVYEACLRVYEACFGVYAASLGVFGMQKVSVNNGQDQKLFIIICRGHYSLCTPASRLTGNWNLTVFKAT